MCLGAGMVCRDKSRLSSPSWHPRWRAQEPENVRFSRPFFPFSLSNCSTMLSRKPPAYKFWSGRHWTPRSTLHFRMNGQLYCCLVGGSFANRHSLWQFSPLFPLICATGGCGPAWRETVPMPLPGSTRYRCSPARLAARPVGVALRSRCERTQQLPHSLPILTRYIRGIPYRLYMLPLLPGRLRGGCPR